MPNRQLLALVLIALVVGCRPVDSKPLINSQPLTEAEKAAIKAEDDRVNAEESAVR